MIQSPLSFERIRKTGQLLQRAVILHLATRDVIFAVDGIDNIDAASLFRYDRAIKYDGTKRYNVLVQEVHQALAISDLVEGSESDPGGLDVSPTRRSTIIVDVDNVTEILGTLVATDSMVGASAEMVLTYPGLLADERVTRFSGEVGRVTLGEARGTIELRSA